MTANIAGAPTVDGGPASAAPTPADEINSQTPKKDKKKEKKEGKEKKKSKKSKSSSSTDEQERKLDVSKASPSSSSSQKKEKKKSRKGKKDKKKAIKDESASKTTKNKSSKSKAKGNKSKKKRKAKNRKDDEDADSIPASVTVDTSEDLSISPTGGAVDASSSEKHIAETISGASSNIDSNSNTTQMTTECSSSNTKSETTSGIQVGEITMTAFDRAKATFNKNCVSLLEAENASNDAMESNVSSKDKEEGERVRPVFNREAQQDRKNPNQTESAKPEVGNEVKDGHASPTAEEEQTRMDQCEAQKKSLGLQTESMESGQVESDPDESSEYESDIEFSAPKKAARRLSMGMTNAVVDFLKTRRFKIVVASDDDEPEMKRIDESSLNQAAESSRKAKMSYIAKAMPPSDDMSMTMAVLDYLRMHRFDCANMLEQEISRRHASDKIQKVTVGELRFEPFEEEEEEESESGSESSESSTGTTGSFGSTVDDEFEYSSSSSAADDESEEKAVMETLEDEINAFKSSCNDKKADISLKGSLQGSHKSEAEVLVDIRRQKEEEIRVQRVKLEMQSRQHEMEFRRQQEQAEQMEKMMLQSLKDVMSSNR